LTLDVLNAATTLESQLSGAKKSLDAASDIVSGFQKQLGDVSSEMKSLHDKCAAVRVKVANREALLKHLNAFLGRVAVSNEMKQTLESGRIDDKFLTQLDE